MDDYSRLVAAALDSSQAQFLEHMSDEAFRNYARDLARVVPQKNTPAHYLKCQLSSSPYLLPLTALYEVVMPPHHFACLPSMLQAMLGLVSWRGEAIVAIDLDVWLSTNVVRTRDALMEGTLLIAVYAGFPIALFVPTIELTETYIVTALQPPTAFPASASPAGAACVLGMFDDALVLDVAALLADIVQHLEQAASHG